MAWIDHTTQVYTIFKSDRPLINIPPTTHTHQDPLRTPEDTPVRAPWISTHIDGVYHIAPFGVDHNRFPDIEDRGWAMGIISPPSPSRRNSLELLPDINAAVPSVDGDDAEAADWATGETSPPSPSRRNNLELPPDLGSNTVPDIDELPTLSPPSPRIRSLATLPDQEEDLPPPDLDCPQLSPPSPVHRSTVLPSLEFEAQSLFIEDTTISDPQPPLANTPLHAEYWALSSLRDRTLYAESTSRARNKALRGRERELGRAVAALHASTTASSLDPPPDATTTLHAYRAAATRVMVERTEEKRRRKKDKERLKELRVLLGTGVDALLSTEAALSPDPTTAAAAAASIGLDVSASQTCGLGLALHEPLSAEDRSRALAERTRVMQRLTACMTMRRRDLGMRSLVEAGNMAEGAEEHPVPASCQRSGLVHSIVFAAVPGDPGGDSCCVNEEQQLKARVEH